ncbi:unnamed protein product [Rotaria magnacalcarata]|uniref:VWFA domain-containing protein n=1 Tax=Rotaria magnacalcarata TaxID=392030 RepID=A0A816KUD5_9BILA|nr:unnamed protein product [Rotaria magnacalcarata]
MTTADYSQTSNILQECSICLSPLAQQSVDVYTTTCQHKFHFQRLVKNIQARNNVCPLCRTRLDTLVDILNGSVTATGSVFTQNIPTSIFTQTLIQPTVRKTGIWAKLTKPIRNALKHGSNNNACTSYHSIDEENVTALSNCIIAVRQQSIEGHTQFLSIIATTALEFGGQESTKQSNIYGMVTLKAPSILSSRATEKEVDELRVPVDLVCVVDQSISMRGQKIALLKDTLNYIVDQMGPLDRLAIISFDTRAFDRSQGLKLMTAEKKQTLRNAITQNIRASGGTYIGSGLEMAIKLLRDRQAANPLGALLLLTDGQDNQRHDYSNLMEQLPEGVACHTFGYGSDHNNAALLSQLTEQGHGGTFTYIDQVDGVGHAFATVLLELFVCIAKQLTIKLKFNGDYKVTHAHTTYSYQPKQLTSRQITFNMTDLKTDETRNLVFQVHVSKLNISDKINSYHHTIGHVSLEYIDANTNQTIRTEPVPFLLARPSQIAPQSSLLKDNYELDIQRNRAETSEILKRAVVETDYERAREMVKGQLEKIRSSVSAECPLCQQLMWDLEFQYPSQIESSISLATVHMQHEQEHNSHSTTTTISEVCNMPPNLGRYRSKYIF